MFYIKTTLNNLTYILIIVYRPRQTQNIISRCLNFNTEIKGRENEQEKENEENEQEIFERNEEFHRKEKTERHQMSPQEESEEVIYSEGEALEVLYPDNTWDSDDASYEDELFLPSGWI